MGLLKSRSKPIGGLKTNVKPREYFYLGESLALTRLKCGHFIYVDPLEESVCSHLIAHGEWEPWARDIVLGLVEAGDHVLEIGGHVGYYTLGLANKVGPTGSVTTFEANPRMAELAQRSVRFNGYADWSTVVQKAVAGTSGTLKFTVSRQYAGGGHLYIADGMLGTDAEIIEVDAVRLDELELPPIKLIRIDAEGSEGVILHSAEKLIETPGIVICMEWDRVQLESRTSPLELADWLSDKGFKFWQLMTDQTVQVRTVDQLMDAAPCDLIVAKENIFAARVI